MITEKDRLKTKKNSPPPIVFILIGLVLAGGMYWLMAGRKPDQNIISQLQPQSVQDRISLGGKMLVTVGSTPEKQAGVEAFAAGNNETAIAQFQASLQKYRNDPETLIYLNNAKAGSDALKIAVSVPVGSNLNVAQEMLRGVAQAQDEANQNGGINGVKLEVEVINDENDPGIARQVAAELVKDTRTLAVVGHNSSDASLAAAPLYQQGGLVMIASTSFANNLSGIGSYIFRTVPTIRFMADPLAQYVVKTAHKPNIAVCYDSQSQDNLSFKDEFMASLLSKGGKLVPGACDFSSPTFNPDTAIAQAISNGAESLLLSPHVDRLDRALDLARASRGRLALFSSPTLYTIKTLEVGSNIDGLVMVVPWHPTSANSFTARARKLWGGVVNWRTATTYDATRAIIAGLQQNNTRDGLQKALRNPGFSASGASREVQFLPTGDRLGTPVLVQVRANSSGYDFIPLQP